MSRWLDTAEGYQAALAVEEAQIQLITAVPSVKSKLGHHFRAMWLHATCTHVCAILPREIRDMIYDKIAGYSRSVRLNDNEDHRDCCETAGFELYGVPKAHDLLQPRKVGSKFAGEMEEMWCKRYIELSLPMVGLGMFFESTRRALGKPLAEHI